VRRLLALVALLLVVPLGGCTKAAAVGRPGEGRVLRVIDGDTVDIDLGGTRERVRLLGIDTPETVDPRRPVGCFGQQASHRTKELLPPGTTVRLERDLEARDRYGRLLAYVRRADGTFVNQALLEEGFAQTLTIAPNVAYADQFAVAARGAREAGRGLWGACGAGN
jgi:micrococcal nuclease